MKAPRPGLPIWQKTRGAGEEDLYQWFTVNTENFIVFRE
jgi:hypothetical protein